MRLHYWNYSSEGAYFITICCKDRIKHFGSIKGKQVILSEVGKIASQYWLQIHDHFQHVKVDEFIIMPNHLHGLLIVDYDCFRKDQKVELINKSYPDKDSVKDNNLISTPAHSKTCNTFSHPVKNSISVIINQYKSSVKRWCNKNEFGTFKWQPKFYDRILYGEKAIDTVREYIHNNPRNWIEDELYNN